MELKSVENEVWTLSNEYKRLRVPILSFDRTCSIPSLDDLLLGESNSSNDQSETSCEDVALESSLEQRNLYSGLVSLNKRVIALQPRMDRFRKRLTEKDPVTGNPRFGEKTTTRVQTLLQLYDALRAAMETICHDEDGVLTTLSRSIQKDEQIQTSQQLEKQKRAMELEAEKQKQRTLMEQQKAKEEEEARISQEQQNAELAQRAEAARKQKAEEEERIANADRQYIESVKKGLEGVKFYLRTLRKSCENDAAGHSTAIDALHTLFSQIVSHPDRIEFRRIKRDHVKFNEDIGRHDGGKEILIAAGFRFETLEDVPCLFCKEPNIETNLDGWSDWFELLKRTLELIEEEMLK